MAIHRWTPLTFLVPQRYVEEVPFGEESEFRTWARERYDWTEDPWNGFLDFAARPTETVQAGRGDCEDFALVAISWALEQGRSGVGLGFCWEPTRPWPTHVIAFDDEYVYSSGIIAETSVDGWLEDSKYSYVLRRGVG